MGSRSDRLFQKRKAKKKEDFRRSVATLPARKRILIVCEGSKTEPKYFGALVSKFGLTTAEIEICGECGSDPKSVVKFGKEMIGKDPDFEKIFLVFDKDRHVTFIEALNLVNGLKQRYPKKSILAITSNPCFEFWFLLHHKITDKPFSESGSKSPCENVISQLKKIPEFENYRKGELDHFDVLFDKLPFAKKNASRIVEQSKKSFDHRQTIHSSNPLTLVHILVEALEQLYARLPKKSRH